jgi:PAS domain S-box-containing protein
MQIGRSEQKNLQPTDPKKNDDKDRSSKRIDTFSLGILNSLTAHIAVIDDYGKVISVNDAWTKFATENEGSSNSTGIGSNYFEVCEKASKQNNHVDAKKALKSIHMVLNKEIKEFKLEYDCHSPTQERWFLMRATPMNFMGQKAVISHIDITQEKILQKDLIQRENELAALNKISKKVSSSITLGTVTTEILDQLFKILDPDRAMIFLRKKQKLHLIGIETKDKNEKIDVKHFHKVGQCLCGLSVSSGESIISLDIQKDKRCTWEECKRAGLTSFAAIPLKVKNKIIGTLGIASSKRRDFRKQKNFLESIANDVAIYLENSLLYEKAIQNAEKLEAEIADRKETQDALMKSELKYKSLINNIPGLVYRGYSDWSVDLVSGLELISGHTVEELNLKEKKWLSIIHPDDLELVLQESSILRHRPQNLVQTYRIITKNGNVKWIEDRKNSLLSSEGLFVGTDGIVFDITERKMAEKEKAELKNRLQQAQKMESIGTLAGGIAHDFNNILSAVLGYTDLALQDTQNGTLLHNYLSEVMTAGNRAKNLVKQILTISRYGNKELKLIKIVPLIKEVLIMLRSTIPTSIEFHENMCGDPLIVNADPTQLHQIILNLATNAKQAMVEGSGVLEVGVDSVAFDSDIKNKYPDMKPGKYARITVSDTGTGIPEKNLDKIFEPYFTTKEKEEGTGLGLSVVHGIVKSHNGLVTVYSIPGKGTTFHVYLPLVKKTSSDLPEQKTEPLPVGTEWILLVDDEPPIVKMQQQHLEQLGYTVTARTSSMEALEALRSSPDKFDLVITDMTMPKMTGDKLSREIKEIRSDIPVILCTGFSEKINGHGENLDIEGFLMKPIDKAKMAKTIRQVLDEAKGYRCT